MLHFPLSFGFRKRHGVNAPGWFCLCFIWLFSSEVCKGPFHSHLTFMDVMSQDKTAWVNSFSSSSPLANITTIQVNHGNVFFSVTRRSRSDESHSLSDWVSHSALALTLLMWPWWVMIPIEDFTDVILKLWGPWWPWWKLSSDESYLVVKVI